MRMDIENSPDARIKPLRAAARHNWGHSGRQKAGGDGGMCEKRFCCTSHSAISRGECARRLGLERGLGVLWRHASVNLVEPRSVAPAAAWLSRKERERGAG
jgi:hypothetical protein